MRLEELIEEKRKKLWIRGYLKKKIRRRPRDPEKEKLLIILDYMRFRRFIQEGKLEIIGDRRYRLKI